MIQTDEQAAQAEQATDQPVAGTAFEAVLVLVLVLAIVVSVLYLIGW